jgi:hypothetical protein
VTYSFNVPVNKCWVMVMHMQQTITSAFELWYWVGIVLITKRTQTYQLQHAGFRNIVIALEELMHMIGGFSWIQCAEATSILPF